MRVGQPRWRLPATCSTACWTWDARTTSASPEHVGAGVSAAAPLIPAPRWPEVFGGLKLGGVWGQVDEPEALRHDQVRRGVPASISVVELKHDDALASCPDFAGKQRQQRGEERLGHPVRHVPEGLA